MADLDITVTIKDSKLALCKELWEYRFFNGEVQPSTVLKADIEVRVENYIRGELLTAKEDKTVAEGRSYDPFNE